MSEHARIARYLAPLTAQEPGAFHLHNDAASLTPPAGKTLVLTTDSVIAGTHVPPDATAEQCIRKLMRRNLSDMAAMGATPWRYLLNLHLPQNTDDSWWEHAAATLASEQARYGVVLIGGDCTSGAASPHLTMTMLGLATATLSRSGAKAGDDVYVSGTLGDAALWLEARSNAHFAARYYAPEPRLALGRALQGIATSCIDISDGLLADADQLTSASHVQFMLQQPMLPLSPEAQHMLQQNPALWRCVFSGGDDYELLFTAPCAHASMLQQLAQQTATPLQKIGSVREGSGVVLTDGEGRDITPSELGFQH
jgi:thiamine-monophosphate kinase